MTIYEAGWSRYGYLFTAQCLVASLFTGAAVVLITKCVNCWKRQNNTYRSDRETEIEERDETEENIDRTNERPNEEVEEKTDIKSLSKQKAKLLADIEKLQEQFEDAQSDYNMLRRSNRNLKADLEKVKEENERTKRRLTEILTERMEVNTANVLDFNNPAKLAETNAELYKNEWMSAYNCLLDFGLTESASRDKLLTILMKVHSYCHSEVHIHIQMLVNEDKDAVNRMKHVLKRKGDKFYPSLYQTFSVQFFEELNKKMPGTSSLEAVTKYTECCFKLCWYMAVQDPPIVFLYGPNNTTDAMGVQGQEFLHEFYREYTKTGKTTAFIVWPVMFHETVLCKGVAEGEDPDK